MHDDKVLLKYYMLELLNYLRYFTISDGTPWASTSARVTSWGVRERPKFWPDVFFLTLPGDQMRLYGRGCPDSLFEKVFIRK